MRQEGIPPTLLWLNLFSFTLKVYILISGPFFSFLQKKNTLQ